MSTVRGAEQVITQIENVTPNVRQELVREITKQAIRFQSYVVSKKLSGQVLKRRTGTLARSIQWRVLDTPTKISGFVGSRIRESRPLPYAAPHEYGFKGAVSVKESLRTMTTAFGREVKNPRQIRIRAHTRNVDVPERSYLRSSLAELRTEIIESISKAATKGVK